VDRPWLLGGIKSLSYAINMAATREAEAQGVEEVLFTATDGRILEGPKSGFMALRDGVLWTTPREGTGVLKSITVSEVFRQADLHGQPTKYDFLRAEDLDSCQGAWIASAIRGILPITTLNGRRIPHDLEFTSQIGMWAGFEPLD
jgi:4-amino-4-deoxychorismate lyase